MRSCLTEILQYDQDDEARREQAVKIEKLESAELIHERSHTDLSPEEQQKNQSFTDSLVNKV